MGDWMKDLENMERVVEIFELLGGKAEPRVAQLVTPYRRIVQTTDCLLREAPFSTSQRVPHRLFLFRDLVLLARVCEPAKSLMSAPSVANGIVPKKRRSFIASLFSSSSSSPAGGASASAKRISIPAQPAGGVPPTYSEKVKLTHYLPLVQCTMKAIPNEDAGLFGVQLTNVSRVPAPIPDTDRTQIVTRVEKIEFWFNTRQEAALVLDTCQRLIEDLLEESSAGRDKSVSSFNDAASAKDSQSSSRAWAKNRSLKRGVGMGVGKRDSASFDMRSSLSLVADNQALSLADLESRYNIDFTAKELPENTSVFTVEFGEGQMGFSLSSGAGVGVLVGKVASGSFAEVGGVTIGDRLTSVNGVDVDMDMTWQKAVELIKAAGRPVVLGFTRNAAVKDKVDEKEKPDGKRKWATGRAQRASVRGLVSLVELEKMYASTASDMPEPVPESDNNIDNDNDDAALVRPSNVASSVLDELVKLAKFDEERQCLAILNELLDTERSYVDDLRALIKEYVIPLRRATKRRKCRDKEDGALVCEHGSLRSGCAKPSSESQALLSADDIRIIFMNTETLVKVNAELLHAINSGLQELATASERPTLIRACGVFSNAFSKITPFFTMYSLYCHQYSAAQERLHTIRQNDEDVDAFLRQRESRSSLTSLRSLLIKPVQRICRYPLLFQELLRGMRSVEKVSPDAAKIRPFVFELEGTTDTVEKIANDVNKKVEDQDSIENMLPVFHELGGTAGGDAKISALMAPQRRFVRAEEVCFREAPFEREAEPCRLYLFNDLVVLAQDRDSAGAGGTGNGSGGGGGSIRRAKSGASLLDKRKTRGRSLSNLLGARESSEPTEDKLSLWTMQHTHWIELSTASVQAVPKPDEAGWLGFQLKSIERQVVDPSKLSKADKKQLNGSTMRVVTSVNKFEIWMSNKERLTRLMEDIEEHINRLEIQQDRAERGVRRYGASDQKKTRSWKVKRQASNDGGGSIDTDASAARESTAGEESSGRVRRAKSNGVNLVDKTTALAALEKKYAG